MNKKSVIQITVMSIVVILSLFFLIKMSEENNISTLLLFIPSSLSIFLLYKFDYFSNKKHFIYYKIIMGILTIYNILFLSFLVISSTSSIYSINQLGEKVLYISNIFSDINMINCIIYFVLIISTLLLCFDDLDKKINNTNFYMILISSFIVIFIHVLFFSNPYLKNSTSDTWYEGSSIFIEQNYTYFMIMYLIIIVNKFINKKYQNK